MTNWLTSPLESYRSFLNERDYSEKSKDAYLPVFAAFIRFLDKHDQTLSAVNERLMTEWLLSLGVAYQTEIRYLSLLSQLFDQLFDEHVIDENFAKTLIAKKKKLKRGKAAKRLPVALNESEFNLLMAQIDTVKTLPRRRIAVLLMLGCGLRAEEVCSLAAKDIYLDTDKPYLRIIGKGNKERLVPIPDGICAPLLDYQDTLPLQPDITFIGVMRKGVWTPLTTSGLFRLVQEQMRAAGVVKERMSPHVLRHTYATRQLQAGVPIATLKVWMGHDSIATTMVYEHSVVARSGVRPKF